MERRPMTGALCAALCSCALALCSCATSPAAPEGAVEAVFESVVVEAVDLDTVRVVVLARARNGASSGARLSSLACRASSGEASLELSADLGGEELAAGGERLVALEGRLDVPEGDSQSAPLRLEATLSYGPARGEGGERAVSASMETEFPRVRAPLLSIESIRILKDELINTKLAVGLRIDNPNAFAVRFESMDYGMYGEGRYWASGSLARPVSVPAGGSASVDLYLVMNFTGMDRQLFDKVVKLALVRYRLEGKARVSTGERFLPEFVLPFDKSGSVVVR